MRATTHGVGFWKLSGLFFSMVLLGFVGCGLTVQDGSESHFSKCTVDSDCSEVGQACVGGYCQDTKDASVAQDGASADAFCAVNDHFEHVANLETFCGASATFSRHCPKDRNDLLGTIPSSCAQDPSGSSSAYPRFWRGCGYDVVSLGEYVGEYYFDSITGALVGAYLDLGSGGLGCNDYAGFWRVGEQAPSCAKSVPFCDLCVVDPTGCPADIAAEIPTTACTPPTDAGTRADAGTPADAGTCSCAMVSYAPNGAPCDPRGACSSCTDNNCSATCVCMRDGTFRYRRTCELADGSVW